MMKLSSQTVAQMFCLTFGISSECWQHFNHLSSNICNRLAKTTAVSDSLVESQGAITDNRHDSQTLAKSPYHLLANKQTKNHKRARSTSPLWFISSFLSLWEIKVKKPCISLSLCTESSRKHFSPKILELAGGKGNFGKLLGWWGK